MMVVPYTDQENSPAKTLLLIKNSIEYCKFQLLVRGDELHFDYQVYVSVCSFVNLK